MRRVKMDIGLSLPQAITAVAALGTASFGLVDACKAFDGGPSRVGFARIERVVRSLVPSVAPAGQPQSQPVAKAPRTPLALDAILDTLRANWINGSPVADQKAIAKSLIKLCLKTETAADFANRTAVDVAMLKAAAAKMSTGEKLTPAEADVLGRFDLILTTALDEGYQRADQRYRNFCKGLAVAFSIVLALVAEWTLRSGGPQHGIQATHPYVLAGVIGLLATPLAPIAKDLSTALQTASKAVKLFQG